LNNTEWHLLKGNVFDNFQRILTNKSFINSVKNTVIIWIMNFIPQITLAMLLTAWFTARRITVKGQGFFKVIFYMPNIITAATIAILFRALFAYPTGPVNDLLVRNGIVEASVNFAVKKTAAKILVAFIQFWTWYGYTMIILISGVLGISPDIYEAADIDGANGLQIFFRITIPNLKTVLLYTLVTSLIGGLNMFDIPKLFLNGGPDNSTKTASVFIYEQAFSGKYLYNRAAAASMLMFVVIAICSAILFYLMRDKDAAALAKLKKQERKAAKKRGNGLQGGF
jgi:multiple sugar transport system permease protein